jgi:hypothetical protein
MLRRICLIGVAGVLAAACAEYRYVPSNATSQLNAPATASEQAMQGNVRIISLGMQAVPAESGLEGQRALHLQMTVANNEARPWSVDPQRQTVDVPGRQPLAPIFVKTANGAATSQPIEVAAGGQQVIDLYYALPADERPKNVPQLSAAWQVQTMNGTARGEQSFRRVERGPTMACGPHATQYCLSGYT